MRKWKSVETKNTLHLKMIQTKLQYQQNF